MLAADLIFQGLIQGVFYALMAIGLSLIFGILKVVNFAHGEFYMIGAYAYTIAATALGIPVWLCLPVAFLVGAALGWVTERTLMRPLYSGYTDWGGMKDEYAIIVTFGLSLLLINAVDKFIGPYAVRGPELLDVARLEIGPFMANGQRIAAVLTGIVVLAAVLAFLRFTFWGRQIQAVAQNKLGASLIGIDTGRVSATVFALAGGLAAFAGGLLAPIISASPDVGLYIAAKSFVIVVIGGLGSITGAIVAALLLGVFESFAAVYISYDYRDTFAFVFLILVLLFRPQGLFGERGRAV